MKKSVLFLCTANSARSIMAEAVLRAQAGDLFDVLSAGTEPGGVDHRAIDALVAFGLNPGEPTSKSVASLADRHFDFVITLCSKARKECRQWPGSGVVMDWDFADPAQSNDPRAFKHCLQEISERIRLFVLVNSKQTGTKTKALSTLDFFKALADETRLLSLLLIHEEGELCVCELMAALDIPQPKISRHLAQLRTSGLLLDRRQGQWVYYRIHPLLNHWMADVLRQTADNNQEALQQARTRLAVMTDRPTNCAKAC
ncbi:MAG: metalloregulator ArsR/SmtB family transcription factor [Porticoccaceae bacterium]